MRETSLRRSSTCWKTFTRSTSETTSSPSVPSSLYKRLVRLRPDVFFNLLLLVQELRGVLEFFVFDQTLDQFRARVTFRAFLCGERVGRQKHFRLDVDQSRGHINKVRRHVDVQLFQLVEIFEVLRGDQRNLNVVDIHFLLLDQIKKQVQRSLVQRYVTL